MDHVVQWFYLGFTAVGLFFIVYFACRERKDDARGEGDQPPPSRPDTGPAVEPPGKR